jgi:hypothetical protein
MKDFLTDQTSAVLPPAGGYGVQTREQTNFRDIVRTGRVSATVIGEEYESGGLISTVATATIENLDIMGFIKADAIVSRIAAQAPKHPTKEDAMHPTVFFLHGSAFHGLTINGTPHQPPIDDIRIEHLAGETEGEKPCIRVGTGYQFRADFVGGRAGIAGLNRERPDDEFMEFPEFGRVYLCGFDIFKGRATLTMLRVELGCATTGSVSCPVACVNGHTPKPVPPPKG